jgi:hypothetical protein
MDLFFVLFLWRVKASSRRSADSGESADLADREMELLESVFCKTSKPKEIKTAPKSNKDSLVSLVCCLLNTSYIYDLEVQWILG